MKILKKKSLIKEIPDNEVDGLGTIRFISFESAIKQFHQFYNISDTPISYIITEDGIQIKYN